MPEETNTIPMTPSSPTPADVATPIETPPVVAPTETTTPPVITAPEPIATSTPEPIAPPAVPPTPSTSAKATVDESPPSPESPIRSLLSKALAKIRFRKQAKLEKIMVLAKSKGQITNDDAQKLLRVSDATATRYLSELVKNGRLRRAGIRGGAVYHFVQ